MNLVTNQNINRLNTLQSNVSKRVYKTSNLYLIFPPHTELKCEPLRLIMIQLPLVFLFGSSSLVVCIGSFMAKEKDIILPNDKLMLSGNLSELQFVMLRLHFQEWTMLIVTYKKTAASLENSISFRDWTWACRCVWENTALNIFSGTVNAHERLLVLFLSQDVLHMCCCCQVREEEAFGKWLWNFKWTEIIKYSY